MRDLGYCVPCGVRRIPEQATEVVDGDPMCRACAGVTAKRERGPERAATVPPATVATTAGVRPQQKKEGKVNKGRISDEVRAKVMAEYGSMSNEALGLKYGISGVSVGTFCKGLPKRQRHGHEELSPTRTARLPIAQDEAPGPAAPPAPRSLGAPVPLPARMEMETVPLHVSEAALDRLLLQLAIANKQRAVQYLINEGLV